MKRLLIASLFMLPFFSSCWHMFGKRIRGNGHIQTETRNVSGFNSVEVSGAIDVFVKQDSAQSVKIETDANLLAYIVVREEGGTLKIYPKDNSHLDATGSVKVYVTGAEFKRFEASGACDFYSQNKISNTEKITLDLSGASNADLELNTPLIKAEVTGASKLVLKGETKNAEMECSGSSDLRCFNLLAENIDVDVSGASSAEIFASIAITGSASGASSIKYKGTAKESVSTSGASGVHKVE